YWHPAGAVLRRAPRVAPPPPPHRGPVMHGYAADYRKFIQGREFILLVWETDGEQVGFSTADKIRFGHEAHMHLHIVHPQRRRAGTGLRCVQESVRLYFELLQLERLLCEPNAFNVAPNR